MWLRTPVFLCLILLLGVSIAAAQTEECAAAFQGALDRSVDYCQFVTDDEICYGSGVIVGSHYSDHQPVFRHIGDIAALADLKRVVLSRVNANVAVAVARVPAPSGLSGLDAQATLLAFGDVLIEPRHDNHRSLLWATTSCNPNIRSGPSETASVIGNIQPDDEVLLDGRTGAADWLRFQKDETTFGWIYAPLMKIEGNVYSLDIVGPDELARPPSHQTEFFLTTDNAGSTCSGTVESGVLVSAPPSAGGVTLSFNGVDVTVGSIAYVQAPAEGDLKVTVVDGWAEVTAGHTVNLGPGQQAMVPMQHKLPAGEAMDAQAAEVDNLPLSTLDRLTSPRFTTFGETWAWQGQYPLGPFQNLCEPGDQPFATSHTVEKRAGYYIPGFDIEWGYFVAGGTTLVFNADMPMGELQIWRADGRVHLVPTTNNPVPALVATPSDHEVVYSFEHDQSFVLKWVYPAWSGIIGQTYSLEITCL